MRQIELNNKQTIPQIGVGTWTLRGETASQNVRLALEAGFRHIDTAQGYENEAEVGQGIAESGVSNFNRHHLDDLLSFAEIRPVINQIEVHPLMTQEENIAYNRELGIQVEAWGPFGQGDIDIVGHPLLQSLARKYQKSASQIVLRWIVQRDLITIPRAKPSHFAENMEIMTFSLSDEDMRAISGLNQNLRSNVLNDPETFPW